MKWVHSHHINYDFWACQPPSEEIRVETFRDENIVNIDITFGNLYGQINLPVENTTPSNLGPSTIYLYIELLWKAKLTETQIFIELYWNRELSI